MKTTNLFELHTFSVVHYGEVLLVVVQVIQREGPMGHKGGAGLGPSRQPIGSEDKQPWVLVVNIFKVNISGSSWRRKPRFQGALDSGSEVTVSPRAQGGQRSPLPSFKG